jgi:hypothetical protein
MCIQQIRLTVDVNNCGDSGLGVEGRRWSVNESEGIAQGPLDMDLRNECIGERAIVGSLSPFKVENGFKAKAIALRLDVILRRELSGGPQGFTKVLAAANELVGPRTRRNTESQKTGLRVS